MGRAVMGFEGLERCHTLQYTVMQFNTLQHSMRVPTELEVLITATLQNIATYRAYADGTRGDRQLQHTAPHCPTYINGDACVWGGYD